MFVEAPPEFNPEGLEPPPLPVHDWPIRDLAPDVSGHCNLACRYCAEGATLPARPGMTLEMLAAAWPLLYRHDSTAHRSIRLGSGEPLLGLPLLRRLDELVEQSPAPRPSVHITTNGTLATQEVRDWMVAAGWHVKISLDGPPAVHNRWRIDQGGQGTYERIADAVTDLAGRLPPERFGVTAVLCAGTDPQEVFDSIAALGVRRIELVPVVHRDQTIMPSPDDIARYEKFVMAHARRYLDCDDWSEIPALVEFTGDVFRLMGYLLSRIPCGAGRSMVGVAPDGWIYPCFRFIGLERYRLGRLPEGIDPAASAAFQRGVGRPYEERAACRACWAAPLCGGPCFACAEMFGPGDGEPLAIHCAYRRACAGAATWLVAQLREHDLDKLLRFLPDSITAILKD